MLQVSLSPSSICCSAHIKVILYLCPCTPSHSDVMVAITVIIYSIRWFKPQIFSELTMFLRQPHIRISSRIRARLNSGQRTRPSLPIHWLENLSLRAAILYGEHPYYVVMLCGVAPIFQKITLFSLSHSIWGKCVILI